MLTDVTAVPLITGLGLATPLGGTASSTWRALLDGRFITDHARARARAAGDLCDSASGLALQTAREAVAEASWTAADCQRDDSALVIGTSKGPIEKWLGPHRHMDKSPYLPYTTVGRSTGFGLAEIASIVARELGFARGPRLTLSAACASGLHGLIRASMLIQAGQARRVLVIAAESSLHPIFLGSFKRLGVLPRDGVGCRPFDVTRDGFLMSTAAAAVCLEAAPAGADASDDALSRDAYARVERFGISGDAVHLTAGDPDAAALRQLLQHVNRQERLDLIHAHGTGTRINDPIELAAIERCVADSPDPLDPPEASDPPALYSHKGALGHSLGAAGLVSVVLNCLMHRRGLVPPSPQTRTPLPMSRVRIEPAARERTIRRSLAIAAGFGGPIAAVSLASPACRGRRT